ncbi:NuoM family protein [Campylobacter fetus]|uniref:complex I subunit 4 family protein n=1 Tax=Campylobacter fetus TaxID=196 RepID=UPI000818A75C|nr:NADH-quinone oxidoreductase subunit M [Campylobacter fetus]EAH8300750.1 NADH-quinone oxidoreductase subunit M [Campylobacter fetus]EAI7233472.1 NADH-quinone oxidoreductase subunit M [Campylobacter fetus]EAJ5691028.1 NADH-quinone oxidoreductase subunit M [Campylobacter fetus]EAK0428984.1 NADH-quinone oxidoreductase subunit M [Campylobacter fetus]EAK5305512.1 NADH-quinone oxidoreductase subunit M [Campylobacter fetus]
MTGFSHILSLIIFLPFIVGVLIALFFNDKAGKLTAFVVSIVVAVLGLVLFFKFDPNAGMQFVDSISLVPKYGISYLVGVDGINLYILLIITSAFPPLFFILKNRKKGYWANMLFMQSGFLSVVSSLDLVYFYAGWEMMLIPIFIMVGIYGKDSGRAGALMDMMYYAIFGSMIMLGAIIYIGAAHYYEFGFFSFRLEDLIKVSLNSDLQTVLFFCFMLAFVIKLPLFPFHLWMSNAYTKSLTTATFMLSVIASKVAVFAILRFVLPLFPVSFVNYSTWFISLGLFSMLYFGISAIKVKDFKTLLAYASASHLGLIIAGVFALDVEAMTGSMYQVVAHAITSGIMFLLVGMISEQLGTRKISKLGGLAIKAPVFATIFAIAMISSVGLPATVGFVGELLIIFGLFKANLIYGIFGTTSIVIGAIYMFIVYRKAILQNTNELTAKFKDLRKREILAFLVAVAMIFIMGIYPKPFIKQIEPTMNEHYESYIKPNLGAKK